MEHAPAHALDYLSMIRRRRWWFVLPLVAALAVGVAVLQWLPREYRSSATLGVRSATVSPTLTAGAAVLDKEERLRALSQQLLSRDVLARVVEAERPGGPEASAAEVDAVKSRVQIRVADPVAGTGERRLDAFVLSYTDGDPVRAQRVANGIVTTFVDENSRARAASAETTAAYLASALQAKRTRLVELEEGLRQAKQAFNGRLPEQAPANMQALAGLHRQIETGVTTLRGQQDRLTLIEHQIRAMEEGAEDAPAVAVDTAAEVPEARVTALEAELAAARGMYTDKHPEVIRLQEAVAHARASAAATAAATRQQPVADRRARLLRSPAYRQLLADRDLARLQIRELERADQTARRQIGEYQARVEAAPMVEQRLASIQREHDLAQAQYQDLVAKYEAALVAEDVARSRGGEQFTVLYAATLPSRPVSPLPWRVMLIALMAGLCLGGAFALGREYLDRSVHSGHDLADEFDLPVLGEVTHVPAS